MTAPYWWLFVVIAVAPVGQEDGAGTPASGGSQTGVVANRPPAAAGAAVHESEDRPIERKNGQRFGRSTGGTRADGATDVPVNGWQGVLRGWWPLIVVLAIIAGVAIAARRWLPKSSVFGARGVVEVLGRQYLSSKQSVAVLKVGRRVVVVGMTPERLTHLDTITDADEVADLVGRAASGRPGSLSSAFEREVLREAAAYAPCDVSSHADDDAPADTLGRYSASGPLGPYAGAARQLRGLLSRVRALAVTVGGRD